MLEGASPGLRACALLPVGSWTDMTAARNTELVEKRVFIATTHQWATVFHLTSSLIADHVRLPHGVRALYSTARPTGQPLLLPVSGPAPCPVLRKERSLYLERFPP